MENKTTEDNKYLKMLFCFDDIEKELAKAKQIINQKDPRNNGAYAVDSKKMIESTLRLASMIFASNFTVCLFAAQENSELNVISNTFKHIAQKLEEMRDFFLVFATNGVDAKFFEALATGRQGNIDRDQMKNIFEEILQIVEKRNKNI